MDETNSDLMTPGDGEEAVAGHVPAQSSPGDQPLGGLRQAGTGASTGQATTGQATTGEATTVADIMTPAPVGVYYSQTIGETARIMRDTQIGAVLVVDDGQLSGMVTDRDLVVRGLADGEGPDSPVGPLCSAELVGVAVDAHVGQAAELMREHAVRRLPVISDGQVVGIVSIGDIAISGHDESPLAAVSQAQANV